MPHSIENLQKLTEDGLRQQSLIPLLRAMGYLQVEHYHGPNELGKDIVGWREAMDGVRENVAIVVKRGKITAKAATDVNTVATQVRQAYNSTFLDKVTGEEQPVHRVIVATSGIIKSDARKAILSAIGGEVTKHVRFWDGNTIVDLLNEHLPERAVTDDLEIARRTLSDLKFFVVEPTLTEQGTVYKVEAREEGISAVNVTFHFPDTPEGKRARRKIRRFFEEGHEVTIPGKFIERFEQHEELARLFGNEKPSYLKMGSVIPKESLPIHLVVDSFHEHLTYEGLRLRAWRSGSKKTEFRTEKEGEPIRLRLIIFKEGKASIKLTLRPSGHAVHRVYQALKLWQVLAEGGTFELRHSSTNQRYFRVEELPERKAYPPSFLQLLSDLLFIQEHFQTPLMLPQRIDEGLAQEASELRQVLQTGKYREPFDTISMELNTEQVRNVLKLFPPNEPRKIALANEGSVSSICGHRFDLGPMTMILEPVSMTPEDYNSLESSVSTGQDSHHFVAHALPECEGVHRYFPRYLNGEALEEYRRVYADVPKHEAPPLDS